MAVTAEYREFVLEQLRTVRPVTSKAMFGGIGIYSRGTFFALIADDVLYFKVDDDTRGRFEDAGAKPFTPYGKKSMNYYEVPADVIEDEEELRAWSESAIRAARSK